MSGFFLDVSRTPEIQGNVVSFVTSQSQNPSSLGGGGFLDGLYKQHHISRRGIVTFYLGFQGLYRAQ